ncbi:hypothetical protein AVEN_130623-1 [Araneus ventricosus]|uniref:Integrase catalytic domain-containing protein n=1 Tax=Araneus ventricosus TaxID=182803 RepID=A0A4Y2PL92_ARAVE|nr:hypothetical protein AVEN_130623-1 [Araneus ventricosus]
MLLVLSKNSWLMVQIRVILSSVIMEENLTSKRLEFFLKKKRVVQIFTAPYTTEKNGGSEKENRTIFIMVRTLKNFKPDVEFPLELWAALIKTSVYILNRTGKSSVTNLSPYE